MSLVRPDPNRHRLLRSSEKSPALYLEAAAASGAHAGRGGDRTSFYGGGSQGSMGRLAAGALGAGGKVVGILPRFMDELEWGHQLAHRAARGDSMPRAQQLMLELADAVWRLPGGCGTLEELFEAIT